MPAGKRPCRRDTLPIEWRIELIGKHDGSLSVTHPVTGVKNCLHRQDTSERDVMI